MKNIENITIYTQQNKQFQAESHRDASK